MEQILLEASRQTPALGVMALMVYLNMRIGSQMIESQRRMFVDMHTDHLEARKEQLAALKENAEANQKVATAIAQFAEVARGCKYNSPRT
jgi:uncharacterized tellurite resistance protein B-like protein